MSQTSVLRGHRGAVRLLMRLGEVLLSLADDGAMGVWNATAGSLVRMIELPSTLTPTCWMHPATYVNKVVIGAHEGVLQLWNFRTGKLVHEFQSWAGVPITALDSAPAIDVVAIGLADGRVVVHNLRVDEVGPRPTLARPGSHGACCRRS